MADKTGSLSHGDRWVKSRAVVRAVPGAGATERPFPLVEVFGGGCLDQLKELSASVVHFSVGRPSLTKPRRVTNVTSSFLGWL
jgi:hypothetical protein